MTCPHDHPHPPIHGHAHDDAAIPVFTGNDPGFRRALILIILINAGMFFLEIGAGHWASSQSLLADALDFLADSLTYGLSFIALSWTARGRANAALFKAATLLLMSLYVMGSTLYHVFVLGLPMATVMGGVALLAFIANALSVLLLYRWRDGDANIRSVWLCSRNDALGNVAVLAAAIGVFGTGTAWPDLIVAGIMGGLFLQTSLRVFRQARAELASLPR